MRPTWRRIPASHTDREVTYKTAVWHVCGAVGRHSRCLLYTSMADYINTEMDGASSQSYDNADIVKIDAQQDEYST